MLNRKRPRVGRCVLAVVMLSLLVVTAGCTLAQTPFAKAAGDAGSAFAAAATTLTYAHSGKLTNSYAKASFAAYQQEVKGLEQTLPSLDGAPDENTIQRLIAQAKPAQEATKRPCLASSCDWRTQVEALRQASEALLQASEA